MKITPAAIKAELAKRNRRRVQSTKRFNLKKFLFKEQHDFVTDPAPFKTAVCSRRSGKTIACAAHLVDTAIQYPGVTCLYITLSRNNAKKIVWKELHNINVAYKLNATENLSELSMSFPNGSVIYLSGAKDTSEIEKFRGLALKLVYLDECQSFRAYIQELIDDIISPALMDYAGSLCLIGTPGPVPTGYFHDCAVKSSSWSHHAWTFWDNPFILKKSGLTHQQMLERELKRRGIAPDNPSIQREWFGKWVLDADSLLLHYNPTINDYDTLKTQKYTYIMGVDIGFHDADALAILAWTPSDPAVYLVEEVISPKQGITELTEQMNMLRKKYDVSKIVMDTGGLGKKIAEELIRRWQIPVQAADKVRKMENIALLNDALRSGRFKSFKGSRFSQDTYLLEKDSEKSTPDKIVVSNKYHSDIVDSVLYAFRESPAYTYQPPIPKPQYGTPKWQQDEVSRMEEEAEEFFKNQEDSNKGWGNW